MFQRFLRWLGFVNESNIYPREMEFYKQVKFKKVGK
jgi:hypothetical protein